MWHSMKHRRGAMPVGEGQGVFRQILRKRRAGKADARQGAQGTWTASSAKIPCGPLYPLGRVLADKRRHMPDRDFAIRVRPHAVALKGVRFMMD